MFSMSALSATVRSVSFVDVVRDEDSDKAGVEVVEAADEGALCLTRASA